MEQVCSYFPSYKSQCDALVEAYTPQIIQLLVDDVSPKEICTELGLCDALKSKVNRVKLNLSRVILIFLSAIGNTVMIICTYLELI